MTGSFSTVTWKQGAVVILDQTLLPAAETYLECTDYRQVADAIRRLAVRGAPAIGVAAALGLALGASGLDRGLSSAAFRAELERIADELAATRPTAVNLFWALDRMRRVWREQPDRSPADLPAALLQEALVILEQDVAICRRLGTHGAALVPDGARVMTHCNAGALATAGYGTALGVVRAAVEAGKSLSVLADETRPLLQGARLTAWELSRDNIPVTVITDSMAASLMARGLVDLVVVGADRIAANGDTANKIGTYGLAIAAREHGLPFYVAAPLSTIDRAIPDGSVIPIEERHPDEVTFVGGTRLVPAGVPVHNPAFDVTPARLITAIITEWGVLTPPFGPGIAGLPGTAS